MSAANAAVAVIGIAIIGAVAVIRIAVGIAQMGRVVKAAAAVAVKGEATVIGVPRPNAAAHGIAIATAGGIATATQRVSGIRQAAGPKAAWAAERLMQPVHRP